ncbi:BLUF domain-containing protein [Erythrobacter rubeus]|uniref:BLUF domain-containing protein n=1 Tax=Erythrobacter rubeus TaxID=2760803 RepID=UPI0018F8CEDB|nr:BLUF domain-containing protein [Erythrobacter rubeus]
MKQLIYHSQPFGFDHAMLAGILVQARHNNRRNDITGALICRRDVYLQLIEGPARAIDALYSQILRDDRHCNIRMVHSETINERIFPEWEMLDDELPTLIWSEAEIEDGAVEKAEPRELHTVFERIAYKARGTTS